MTVGCSRHRGPSQGQVVLPKPFRTDSRGCWEIAGFILAVLKEVYLTLENAFNGEESLEGGSRGGTGVSRCEGLPVWAFQVEWLLLSDGIWKWRECVQSGTARQIQIFVVCLCQ